MALTEKQKRFAAEYLVDLNATKAAERAGYSTKTAYAQGHRLLKNAEVAGLVAALQKARAEKLELSADRVLLELMRVAYSNIRAFLDENGCARPMDEIPEEAWAAVASVEFDWDVVEDEGSEPQRRHGRGRKPPRELVSRISKIKLWPKVEAAVALGKHLKLFTEEMKHKHEVSGPNGAPIPQAIEVVFVGESKPKSSDG